MPRCVAITKKGDRCLNNAISGSNKCRIHGKKQPHVLAKSKSLCDRKLCTGNKICNPETGRCVNLKGKTGQKLKPGVKPEVKPEPQPKTNTILNPYLGTGVDPHGKDNCAPNRITLERIPISPNRNILSRYCDVLPLKDIRYIVGPRVYTEFRYKKYKIGIFGEAHSIHNFPKSSKTDTVTFSGFLTSLVTQSQKQYDFFAELIYRNRDFTQPTPTDEMFMLNVLEHDFKGCLQVMKNCPYKNLRAHYVDIRFLYPERDNLAYKIYTYTYDYNNRATRPPGDLANLFLRTAEEEYDKQTKRVSVILKDKKSKIAKQLRHNDLRKEITDFIRKTMQTNKKAFKTHLKQSKKTINKDFTLEDFTEEDLISISLLVFDFLIMFAPIMDTYTLGRIFRIYPNHPGGSAENIIIYGGTYHTDLYVSFLSYIRAKKIMDIHEPSYPDYVDFSPADKAKSFLFDT